MRLTHDWFEAALPQNVRVGEGSWLHSSFAFVHYKSQREVGVSIGEHAGVYRGTHFELGPEAEVVIGDYSSIVGAIFVTNGSVRIGRYCFVAHEVIIADSPWALPPTERPSATPGIDIVVGDDVWIGARAIIQGPVAIGDGAIVGAGAVIDSDVPAGAIAVGNPWRVAGYSRASGS